VARRDSSSITNFLQDITDDIKDFLDDEVIDRGRDTERDLRRAARTATDDNGSSRSERASSDPSAQLDQLREAVAALSAKVDQMNNDDVGTAKK